MIMSQVSVSVFGSYLIQDPKKFIVFLELNADLAYPGRFGKLLTPEKTGNTRFLTKAGS